MILLGCKIEIVLLPRACRNQYRLHVGGSRIGSLAKALAVLLFPGFPLLLCRGEGVPESHPVGDTHAQVADSLSRLLSSSPVLLIRIHFPFPRRDAVVSCPRNHEDHVEDLPWPSDDGGI